MWDVDIISNELENEVKNQNREPLTVTVIAKKIQKFQMTNALFHHKVNIELKIALKRYSTRNDKLKQTQRSSVRTANDSANYFIWITKFSSICVQRR